MKIPSSVSKAIVFSKNAMYPILKIELPFLCAQVASEMKLQS